MLRLDNITKQYDRVVLDRVSYTFEPGKLYVIKGVSGCGKTTLLNIIGGVEKSFEGEIVKQPTLRMGYIFQYSLLLGDASVLDNLRLVCDDLPKIEMLARRVGIETLLHKYPGELSGGERQRMAVVRCLLRDPQVILADEPTASLDKKNSAIIAELLASLAGEGRTVIVATHEQCFDHLCHACIHLLYGKIDKVTQNPIPQGGALQAKGDKIKGMRMLPFVIKRRFTRIRPTAYISFALVFLLLFAISTLQNSFGDEYMGYAKQGYAYDAFQINREAFDKLDPKYAEKCKIYKQYNAEQDGVSALYLPAPTASVLALDDMIQYGSYPKTRDEVLVSREYLSDCATDAEYAAKIGTEIAFMGKTLTVSGILYSLDAKTYDADRSDSFLTNYRSDPYYNGNYGKHIYMDYDLLAEIGTLQESEENNRVIGYYPGLYDDRDAWNAFKDAIRGQERVTGINALDRMGRNMQEYFSTMSFFLLGIFAICFVLFCIFIRSKVDVELFYRKREIGFLQLFGVSRWRIFAMLLYEYVLRLGVSLCSALLLYGAGITAYRLIVGRWIVCNPWHVLIALLLATALYLAVLTWIFARYMRKSILWLIND